jgi:hypothetical protein
VIKSRLGFLGFGVIAATLAISYTNCSNVKLNLIPPIVEASVAQANLCLKPPISETAKHKIMFIVDKSGSNSTTDPQGLRRNGNIQAFFNQHQNEQFTEWSLIEFGINTNQALALITDGNQASARFGTATEMQTAINTMSNAADSGCTPYIAALTLAQSAIRNDQARDSSSAKTYSLFFLSDGLPTDLVSGGCSNDPQPVTNSPTDPYIIAVKNVLNTAPESLHFHTAYYSPPAEFKPNVGAGLEYMATVGNGKYISLEGNDKLDFGNVVTGVRSEAWMIKRFVVYNMNSAFCMDGSIDRDSDTDGLCDKDEISINKQYASRLNGKTFNPLNRNSIDANYSDLFAFKFLVLPLGVGLPTCINRRPSPSFDILNSCEKQALSDSQANGPTVEWTNRMKARSGSGADTTNPDTDGDGFIDIIEFFQFGVKSTPVNYTNLFERYINGVTGETLMAEHRHFMRPEIWDKASNYDLKVRSMGYDYEGQNCYDVHADNLPTYNTLEVSSSIQMSDIPELTHAANENKVLIYYIATQEKDPNGLGYIHYQYQSVFKGQPFQIDFKKFKEYAVPK